MIRIDLGKDSKKQGEGIRRVASQLKLQKQYDELLVRFDNDVNRLVAFVVAVVVAVMPYVLVGEYARIVKSSYQSKVAAVDKEIAILEKEIEVLTPFKKELESYETQRAQVTKRLGVIRRLLDTRGTPVNVMDAVGQALPEGVWIESLTYEGADANDEKLSVLGRALSNEDISDFVDRLHQSAYLKEVRIASVDPGRHNNMDIRSFVLELVAVQSAVGVTRDVGEAPSE